MMQETGQEFVPGKDEELTQSSTIMVGSTWMLYYTFIYFRGSHMHSYSALFCIKLLTI